MKVASPVLRRGRASNRSSLFGGEGAAGKPKNRRGLGFIIGLTAKDSIELALRPFPRSFRCNIS